MRRMIQSCIIAFAMYSKIPMPKTQWEKENMKYAFCFLPLVGAVIGALTYLFGRYGGKIAGDGIFHTILLMMIPIFVTGGIHVDGLLDTADALNSYKPKEEKLKILKDSHAGAFAIIVGICYFFIQFGAYSELTQEMLPVLSCSFILSRALSALAVVSFRMAKNTGLAATFAEMAVKKRVQIVMICYIVLCSVAMIALQPVYGICTVCAAVLEFFYYRHMAYKQFGGVTGDLAGFYLQTSELLMVVVMVFASYLIG
ncbi:MAG: adenosylcobinamide-GDP ribazoletransferase [Lachnospiraceae bacterium]|nr:adenosylcobinamide-GDP ribazoletransferase [Robinsoniella sp.]MDY3767649.1 adenosylcobinamide-GDP ribazoletransferase [Lachnospiraceae bacterium]